MYGNDEINCAVLKKNQIFDITPLLLKVSQADERLTKRLKLPWVTQRLFE